MKDFWNWFKEKYQVESTILEGIKTKTGYISEKIIIGFMIEYCIEHGISFHLLASSDVKQSYKYLKTKIDKKNNYKNIKQSILKVKSI